MQTQSNNIISQPPPTKWQKIWRKCGWLRSIGRYIKQYFSVSGIHGFAYLVKNELTLFEHFFWLLLLICSLGFCIFTGLQSMERFWYKSTVVGLERDYYFWRTLLPSMTVCPMSRLSQELFDKYCRKKKLEGTAKDEFQQFLESLANSTYINFANISVFPSLDSTLDRLRLRPSHYMSLIYNLTTDYTQLPDEYGERLSVTDGFIQIQVRQVLTEFGLCYMTNNLLDTEYSARFMILNKKPKINKEQVAAIYGSYFDKSVLYAMTMPKTVDSIGVFIHSPLDALRIEQKFFHTRVAVYYLTELRDITTDELFEKETVVAQRNCRFPYESNLTHFPVYTRSLCMQECRLNMVFQKCKCIPHFYPNRIAKPKPVCPYTTLKSCVAKNADYFRRLNSAKRRKTTYCPCLPSCSSSIVIVKKETALENLDYFQTGCTATLEQQTWPYVLLKRQAIFTYTDLLGKLNFMNSC